MSEHAIAQFTCPRRGASRFPVLTRITILACTASIVAGCSTNPIVRWDAPKTADVPEYTLGYGLTYAHRARDAYRDAIRSDTAASQSLSSGLITLGAAIAGLAAFKAHRDTIIGAGLIGGTAFALGNWNFSRQRLLIFQAGVAGINCSIEAVTQLHINPAERQKLGIAVDTLETMTNNAVTAMRPLRNALDEGKGTPADRTKAEELIRQTESLVHSARAVARSARQFLNASDQAGPALVNAVDRISQLVDKAVLEILPDITAVPKVVAGLAGLAGAFAPGTGLESTFAKAAARFGQAEGAPAVSAASAIAAPVTALSTAYDNLDSALAVVNGKMTGRDVTANAAKLVDCGLTGIDTTLKAYPPRVVIKARGDSNAAVRVSGGASTIYSGSFLNAPEGLSVKNPLPGDRTFSIVGSKTLEQAGEYVLVISDAAAKEVQVTVVVEAPPKDAAAPAGGTTDKSGAAAQLVKWLTDTKDLTINDIPATVKTATASDTGNVNLTISCAPQQPLTSELALEGFQKAYGKVATVQTAFAKGVQVIIKGETEACIKYTARAEGKRAPAHPPAHVAGRTLMPVEILAVQRNLCMPEAHQIGIWGQRTIAAVAEWRRKADKKPGPPTSLSKEEFEVLGSRQPVQCPK